MPKLLLLAFLFLTAQAWAQSPPANGNASGVVLSNNSPVAGAKVTVVNKITHRKWEVTANSAGVFVLSGLPAGTYEIQAKADGYQSEHAVEIEIGANNAKPLEVFLVSKRHHARKAASGGEGPPPPPAPPPPPPPIPTAVPTAAPPVPEPPAQPRGSPTGAGGGQRAKPPNERFTTVRIFYATDRKQGDRTQPALFYSGARREAADNAPALELGQCDVSIPFNHEVGELESPVWWKFEFRPDPELHIVLLSVTPQSSSQYFSELRQRVAGSPSKDAFVFVHGYNTTFEDAARRTAQMAYDLKFQGAPILYSWPSLGELTRYTFDENNVEWSWRHLYDFLQTLSKESGATTIHLIAHSMGNRALTNALQKMPKAATPLFNEVILAAPDIDADLFKQMAADLQGKAGRITLYASSKDEALKASKAAHGEPRAGDSDKIVIVAGVDSIDASSAATDFLGHGYVFKDSILYDINNLFRQGKPPQQRDRLKAEQLGSLLYWFLAP